MECSSAGGLLFLVFGLVTFFIWLRQTSGIQITLDEPDSSCWDSLLFVALCAWLGGIINSLITWVVEDRLYLKYKGLN